jgi:hypothetical protein
MTRRTIWGVAIAAAVIVALLGGYLADRTLSDEVTVQNDLATTVRLQSCTDTGALPPAGRVSFNPNSPCLVRVGATYQGCLVFDEEDFGSTVDITSSMQNISSESDCVNARSYTRHKWWWKILHP